MIPILALDPAMALIAMAQAALGAATTGPRTGLASLMITLAEIAPGHMAIAAMAHHVEPALALS